MVKLHGLQHVVNRPSAAFNASPRSRGAPVRGAAAAALALALVGETPGDGGCAGAAARHPRGSSSSATRPSRTRCWPPRSPPRTRAGSPAPSCFAGSASAKSATSTSRNFAVTWSVSTSSTGAADFPTCRSTRSSSGRRENVSIEFKIVEGEPTHVTSLTVRGLDSLPEKIRAETLVDLPLRQGDPFNRYVMQITADTITRRLRDRGYPSARVFSSFETNKNANTAKVAMDVEPGHPAVVGQVRVEGTDARRAQRRAQAAGEPAGTARTRWTSCFRANAISTRRTSSGSPTSTSIPRPSSPAPTRYRSWCR